MLALIESAGVVLIFVGMVWRSWDRNATGPIYWLVGGLALLLGGLVIERASARDLDGRYAQSPSIAVIASICLDRCQDVVVTTSEQDSSVTMMWCAIGGQIVVTEWLAQNKPGYRLAGWKCVVGDKRRGA